MLSHESNMEDSYNLKNLAEIVNVITNTTNYGTSMSESQKLMLEAYCRQSLRDKMLDSYRKLIESLAARVKSEGEEDSSDQEKSSAKEGDKQESVSRELIREKVR